MLVKKKPAIKILESIGDSEIWIFRPFYKNENLNPCSLCILRKPDYLIRYKLDCCPIRFIHTSYGRLYNYLCRQFDTSMFYYVVRERIKNVNQKDLSSKNISEK